MNSLKRLMFVFGTRPEAIKMAPVILEAKKYPDFFETVVVVTAQHRDLLDQALSPFEIKPDYDMAIMEPDQTISNIVVKTLSGLEGIIFQERPDLVLVQGDTSSAFAAALAAFYRKIPVAHVEAGLRTFNKMNPFPEEINRVLISPIADLHFAPTSTSADNLLKENIQKNKIYVTGSSVIDALLYVSNKQYDLKKSGVTLKEGKKNIVVTTHRRESFGAPMRNTCEAIAEIAKKHSDIVEVFIPVHRNPNVKDMIFNMLGDIPGINLLEPMDYVPFVHLMKNADIILTDSGGIQEEAPSLGKPVLVLRETTERPEAVYANTVKLVGTDKELIFAECEKLLLNTSEYDKMAHAVNPYGDGKASERIMGAILKYFGFIDQNIEEFDYEKIKASSGNA